jgi:hypothetical protein
VIDTAETTVSLLPAPQNRVTRISEQRYRQSGISNYLTAIDKSKLSADLLNKLHEEAKEKAAESELRVQEIEGSL